MNALKPTRDRKTKFWNNQKNTYGLLPGAEHSCPGATTEEGGCCHVPAGNKLPVCYVHPLMKAYKNVYGVLAHNTWLLKNATEDQQVDLLKQEFARFRDIELRRSEPQLFYRLHWSGDIFNMGYARAIRRAVEAFPDVRFWIYTRSFFAIEEIAAAENLATYISVDPVNFTDGIRTFHEWKDKNPSGRNLQIAYMSKENDFQLRYNEAAHLAGAAQNERLPMGACPNDLGKLPTDYACATCQKCLGVRSSLKGVWFKC